MAVMKKYPEIEEEVNKKNTGYSNHDKKDRTTSKQGKIKINTFPKNKPSP